MHMDLKALLAEQPVFEGLTARHLAHIRECAAEVHFDSAELVLREGEPAHSFYLILDGKVTVELRTPQGGALVIHTVENCEILGWSWLFPPYRWNFTARASQPTAAVALDGARIRSKCEDDHDLGYVLIRRFAAMMMQRLQAARLQLLEAHAMRP